MVVGRGKAPTLTENTTVSSARELTRKLKLSKIYTWFNYSKTNTNVYYKMKKTITSRESEQIGFLGFE